MPWPLLLRFQATQANQPRFWFVLPSSPDQADYHLEVTIYGVVQGRKQDELLKSSIICGDVVLDWKLMHNNAYVCLELLICFNLSKHPLLTCVKQT